ncbi:hypothetical protein A1O1_01269 [Capronia coronata CBS 617.96]|uniref:Uncharacterized protein n=1 Tax=Capronia coronata CBS 617.96 TaxID=1182541 RepID=W9YUE3_9EURO|nr:uncharacterized protein A1O1_01269 [Capronia coronata CBS 617.96]EXJ96143.1 hypothetical protein A1O1_01269 [Capronia coronata CBS 617.96]
MADSTSPSRSTPTPTSISPSATSRQMNTLIRKHPLQRLPSPSRTTSAAIHIIGLSSFLYSFSYLSTHPNHINQAYGWHFQYLTIIGLALATATFTLGLLADLTLSARLFAAKNVLSMCSAPMEVLITLLYWGLRAIDPQLVVPKELELPFGVDASFHLAPGVFLLSDLLLLSPPWTIGVLPAVALSGAIACVYWYWIEMCYQVNGFYPYPLFEVLLPAQRVVLFAGSAVLMAASTAVLKSLQGRINRGLEGRKEREGKDGRGVERPGNVS